MCAIRPQRKQAMKCVVACRRYTSNESCSTEHSMQTYDCKHSGHHAESSRRTRAKLKARQAVKQAVKMFLLGRGEGGEKHKSVRIAQRRWKLKRTSLFQF